MSRFYLVECEKLSAALDEWNSARLMCLDRRAIFAKQYGLFECINHIVTNDILSFYSKTVPEGWRRGSKRGTIKPKSPQAEADLALLNDGAYPSDVARNLLIELKRKNPEAAIQPELLMMFWGDGVDSKLGGLSFRKLGEQWVVIVPPIDVPDGIDGCKEVRKWEVEKLAEEATP